jgi:hypothetical protein
LNIIRYMSLFCRNDLGLGGAKSMRFFKKLETDIQ